MFDPDPRAYLPHRHPFLFLDRIVALEPGVSAIAVQRVSLDAPEYSHLFLVEAIAQLGGVAAAREKGGGGVLGAIERAEFSGEINAGDPLVISARIVKSFGQLHLVEGEVSCNGMRLASARLTLKVGMML